MAHEYPSIVNAKSVVSLKMYKDQNETPRQNKETKLINTIWNARSDMVLKLV